MELCLKQGEPECKSHNYRMPGMYVWAVWAWRQGSPVGAFGQLKRLYTPWFNKNRALSAEQSAIRRCWVSPTVISSVVWTESTNMGIRGSGHNPSCFHSLGVWFRSLKNFISVLRLSVQWKQRNTLIN